MTDNLISKDQLIDPFTIINEFRVKEIGELDTYVSNISEEVEKLQALDFDPDFQKLMDFGKAVSNDVRLKILYFMKNVDKTCFCELENVLELKQSTLNYHIGLLKRANLIDTHKEGKLIVLQLSSDFQQLTQHSIFDLFNNSPK